MSNTQETEDGGLGYLWIPLLMSPWLCYWTYLLIDNFLDCSGQQAESKKNFDAREAKFAAEKQVRDAYTYESQPIKAETELEFQAAKYATDLKAVRSIFGGQAEYQAKVQQIKSEFADEKRKILESMAKKDAARKPNVSTRSATSAKDKKGQ